MSVRPTEFSSRDEAARWHARLMSGEMAEVERAALRRWLDASDTNRSAFADIEDALKAADEIAGETMEQEYEAELYGWARQETRPGRRYALIAASLLLMAVAAGVFVAAPIAQNPLRVLATDVGEMRKVALADGSVAELNTRTRLEVDFSRGKRAVNMLDGEALFDVARDPNRPFVVTAHQAIVTVTGTVFDVSAIEGRASVHVLSGAVEVQPTRDGAVALLPGESVSVRADGTTSQVARFEPSRLLAWRTGKMRFRDAPISEVVREMNRYYETPIELDATVGNPPVTGEFRIADQDAAVRALAAAFSLEVERKPDRIVLAATSQ